MVFAKVTPKLDEWEDTGLAWEMELFRRTRLAAFENCLKLFEAYADQAPLWERILLSAYVGIGPPVARALGGNTATVWHQAEAILADLFAVTGMSPASVVSSLRHYMKLKRETDHHLPFAQAREQIYDQKFYPLVTHFTFAFQSSAVARMRFVKRTAEALKLDEATVADIGCGSGAMLCEVLRAKPAWTGIGIDVSSSSIDYAQKLSQIKGVADRLSFKVADMTSLPLPSRSIDLLIASEVLEHLPEPQATLAEIKRVLVPGGSLVLTIPIESHTPAHMHSLSNVDEFQSLCAEAGLTIKSLAAKWHLTFGDDPRHLFAVVERETSRVYSLAAPKIRPAVYSDGLISS
jgi:SAM-dependent methyltransferase